MLGAPWDRETFAENVSQLLATAFRRFLTVRILRVNAEMHSSSIPDSHVICRRMEDLIQIDLPFVWLHPTCYFEGKHDILRTTLERLRCEEERILTEVTNDLIHETRQDQRQNIPVDTWVEFSKWVELVVEATESAWVSLSQVQAFESCLKAMYHQWCRERSSGTLNAEQVTDFSHWINGIVEAVVDVEQGMSDGRGET